MLSGLEFGVMYSRFHPLIGPGAFAFMLQRLGFDSVWVGEGPASAMPALDPVVCMAQMAAAERIRIGSCVLLVPLHNPAILAKKVASLDVLSGGRIVFGIGVGLTGASDAGAYALTGTDERARGARCDDYLDVMIKLWRGEVLSHHSPFFRAEGSAAMVPLPLQRPHPPIWAGGDAEGMLRRAGRVGQGFVPVAAGVDAYAAQWRRIEDHAGAVGRAASEITPALHLYYHCSPGTRAQAHRAAERNLSYRYGHEVTLADDGRFAFGSEAACAATIAAYRDVGVRHFVMNLACPLADVEGTLERLATRVLPRLA